MLEIIYPSTRLIQPLNRQLYACWRFKKTWWLQIYSCVTIERFSCGAARPPAHPKKTEFRDVLFFLFFLGPCELIYCLPIKHQRGARPSQGGCLTCVAHVGRLLVASPSQTLYKAPKFIQCTTTFLSSVCRPQSWWSLLPFLLVSLPCFKIGSQCAPVHFHANI